MRNILIAALASVFDGDPISLRRSDFDRSREMVRILQDMDGQLADLRGSIPRNAFLAGCFKITNCQPVEHLLVGFGERTGNNLSIDRVYQGIGSAHSVGVPPVLTEAIRAHLAGTFYGEVLIFHNHPHNVLNALVDNLPIASRADRMAMIRHWLEPVALAKAALGGGRVRFFLGENGFVREFKTPDFDWLATLLPRGGSTSNTSAPSTRSTQQ